eukprot:1329723-Amorphochlora_amoeboformis.AAC.3
MALFLIMGSHRGADIGIKSRKGNISKKSKKSRRFGGGSGGKRGGEARGGYVWGILEVDLK